MPVATALRPIPGTGSWRPLKRPADPFHATTSINSAHRRSPEPTAWMWTARATAPAPPAHNTALSTHNPDHKPCGPWTDDVEDSTTNNHGSKDPSKPTQAGFPWSKIHALDKRRGSGRVSSAVTTKVRSIQPGPAAHHWGTRGTGKAGQNRSKETPYRSCKRRENL